jgi:hypothetical protein
MRRLVAGFKRRLTQATYVSLQSTFVDTENVLIYNVGPAAFHRAAQFGIQFVREFAPVPATDDTSSRWAHYHRYSLGGAPILDRAAAAAALNVAFQMERQSACVKPHDYWWAMKKRLMAIDGAAHQFRSSFELDITIIGPARHAACASVLKPLFDGMISALHFDSTASPADRVCALLADKLSVSAAEVANALRNQSHCLLGERKVVSPYRSFVKWNPADENCTYGRLLPRFEDQSFWTHRVRAAPIAFYRSS